MEYYEGLLRNGPIGGGFRNAPTVVVQTGHGRLALDQRDILALDSPQAVQGDANKNITSQMDQSVRIANSFNERKTQIEDIERLISVIRSLPDKSKPQHEVVTNLEKIKDEIEHEQTPDPGRIRRWLETTKLCLENLKLSRNAVEIANVVYKSFNLAALLVNLRAVI